MLSRDADSCYWMGRYVERTEATARMVDVHYHAALETFLPSSLDERDKDPSGPLKWPALLQISGASDDFAEHYDSEADRDVLNYLCFDTENSNSIVSTWKAARDNARAMREAIASEMWESVNITYLRLREWNVDRLFSESPHEFFSMVKNSSHLFQGILNRTMVMGETRDWLDLGRFSERADQTTRLIDVKFHDLVATDALEPTGLSTNHGSGDPLDLHEWIAVLKSASAFEMYRKTHKDGIKPVNIIDFLIRNPSFPASVRHCIERVDGSLHRINGSPLGKATNEPERLVEQLISDLTCIPADEMIGSGLHEFLEHVQLLLSGVGSSIAATFLSY
jgi:uncharacterized alpha-E superfamily protein